MTTDAITYGAGGFLAGALCIYAYHLLSVRAKAENLAKSAQKGRKDQFISLASHYLLNPITVIQTAVASLQEKGTLASAGEREELYEAIQRGQQRLWIFVQQIILVGEIDAGTLTPQFGVASFEDTVGSAVTAIDPFARAKNVKIHLDDALHEVREARFDARRMKQAVIAILDNAVKFSLEGGEVTVRMSYENNVFSISIEDAGIGMPDEVMSHITEKFYRGTDTYTFDYEGVGLGLYAAQSIVRMHQGNLSITSRPERGTLAVIQFPSL